MTEKRPGLTREQQEQLFDLYMGLAESKAEYVNRLREAGASYLSEMKAQHSAEAFAAMARGIARDLDTINRELDAAAAVKPVQVPLFFKPGRKPPGL